VERFATIISGGSEAGHSTEGELTAGIFGICVVFILNLFIVVVVVFGCRNEFITVLMKKRCMSNKLAFTNRR